MCQFSISSLLLNGQWVVFGFLGWRLAVGMQASQALISTVCQAANMRCHASIVFFEQPKVVHSAFAKSGRDDLQGVLVDHHLCFLRVTPFLAAVVSPLLFLGRSIGCSVTSTSTISMIVSLACNTFLPGSRNWPDFINAFSTFRMVRQTVDSLIP